MNSLKSLLTVVVLGAVAYGVYVSITRNPDQTNTPSGEAPAWPGNSTAQMPGPGSVGGAPLGGSGLTGPPNLDFGSQIPQAPLSGAAMGPGAATSGFAGGSPANMTSPGGTSGVPPSFTLPDNLPTPVQVGGGVSTMQQPIGMGTAGQAAGGPGSPLRGAGGYDFQSNSLRGLNDPSGNASANSLLSRTSPAGPSPNALAPNVTSGQFTSFMQDVRRKLAENRLPEAHRALSLWYGDPELSPAQTQQVTELLDQLAGTVIYSSQPWIDSLHTVGANETLDQIAQQYKVPALLLARINGIGDSPVLQPGQQLKIIRGPFNAQVDLTTFELTLMLDGLYAGRFGIGVGGDPRRLVGSHTVLSKTRDPQYYGTQGTIPPGDANNPLGKFWIGLTDQLGIHGTNRPENLHRNAEQGSISLSDRDIDDVFSILSIGSRVIVRR